MLMPNTAAPCWRARLRKLAWLLPALSLTACSAPPAVIPRIPEPAADLMKPAPTGSEVIYQGRARGHALDRVRTLRQPEPVRVFCPPGLLAPEGNTHQAGVAGVGLDRVVAVLGGDGRRLAE